MKKSTRLFRKYVRYLRNFEKVDNPEQKARQELGDSNCRRLYWCAPYPKEIDWGRKGFWGTPPKLNRRERRRQRIRQRKKGAEFYDEIAKRLKLAYRSLFANTEQRRKEVNKDQAEAIALVVCFGSLICAALAYQYSAIYSIGFVVSGVVAIVAIVMRAEKKCDHQ